MNRELLKQKLDSYTRFANGVNQYYFSSTMGRFMYSDGLKFLAEHADCYWFLGVIASYQHGYVQKFPQLADYQEWHLVPLDGGRAVVSCSARGSDEALIQQVIPSTDFPFDIMPIVKVAVEPSRDQHGPIMAACFPAER